MAAIWFVSPWFPMGLLRGWQEASGGWVSVTLLASMGIGLVQLAIVFGPGRQSFADVGWRARALVPALVATVVLWALMQAATVGSALATGTPLVRAAAWEQGLGIALGPLLAQLLGTALMEETVFRGYLWPQVVLWLKRRLAAWPAAILGLVLSQALFALLHVPILLYTGAGVAGLVGPLLMLFTVGIVFALVYAATGNLFVAVGAHALGNATTLIFQPQGPAPTLVMLAGLLAISAAWWAWRRRGPRTRPAADLAAVPFART
jgi:membrane protease YdiL (CAAX protease family)